LALLSGLAVLLGTRLASAQPAPAAPTSRSGTQEGPMPDRFTQGVATVEGVAIHHVETGQGEPIVLVPGWPETWYAWRRVMPVLAKAGHRAIALDPPGLGDSGPLADGTYDTGRVADTLRAVTQSLGLGRYHLVGHDVGTWISFAWGSRHAADLRSLTLLEAALPGITPDAAFSVENAPKVFQFYLNAVPDLPEMLVHGHEREFLAWLYRVKSVHTDAIGPADLDEYMRTYGDPARMAAGFGYYRAVPKDIEQNRAAGLLPMPVLALGAEKGTGSALFQALKGHAPNLQGGQIDGYGHFLAEECPELLAQRILDFTRQSAG